MDPNQAPPINPLENPTIQVFNAQNSQKPPENNSSNQKVKKLPKILLFLIALLVVLGILGVIVSMVLNTFDPIHRLSKSPTPTITPMVSKSADKTANWKTYEGNGISFKYPTNLTLTEEKSGTSNYVHLKNSAVDYTLELISQEKGNLTSNQPIIKTITFNNIKWDLHDSGEAVACDAGECGTLMSGYQTRNGAILITLLISNFTNGNLPEQILSTFKFTK